jgi:hypothetical protein
MAEESRTLGLSLGEFATRCVAATRLKLLLCSFEPCPKKQKGPFSATAEYPLFPEAGL